LTWAELLFSVLWQTAALVGLAKLARPATASATAQLLVHRVQLLMTWAACMWWSAGAHMFWRLWTIRMGYYGRC
jgi:hypothetical protein